MPEPFAIRDLRLPVSNSGLARSCGVIDRMIASVRLSSDSSISDN